jgi:hypothetical protein
MLVFEMIAVLRRIYVLSWAGWSSMLPLHIYIEKVRPGYLFRQSWVSVITPVSSRLGPCVSVSAT